MGQDLFVQFYQSYSNTKILVKDRYEFLPSSLKKYDLCNGFSSFYSACKDRGDFHWVQYELEGEVAHLIESQKEIELPPCKGTTFISAFYNIHLYQAYLWARRYPERKFVVGGPAALKEKIIDQLPPNLIITTDGLEKVFNQKKSSWGIELPQNLTGDFMFSYPIERGCYWNKCTFCYVSDSAPVSVEHDFVKYLLPQNRYFIFLNSYSMSPNFLANDLYKFKNNNGLCSFWTYIRADRQVLNVFEDSLKKCLQNGLDPKNLWWLIGIEFPSNRMLRHMNKGVVLKDILEVAKIASRYHSNLIFSLILGWTNLEESDVSEAESFFSELYAVTNGRATMRCHYLSIKPGAPMYNVLDGEACRLGPFMFGKTPVLNQTQKILNDRVLQVLMDQKFRAIRDPSMDLLRPMI